MQYTTPVLVVYREKGSVVSRDLFSDLQMAYIWIEGRANLHNNITILPFKEVIEKLFQYYMEDNSGCDVLTNEEVSYTVYYEV
jgi:hypothetical protein